MRGEDPVPPFCTRACVHVCGLPSQPHDVFTVGGLKKVKKALLHPSFASRQSSFSVVWEGGRGKDGEFPPGSSPPPSPPPPAYTA